MHVFLTGGTGFLGGEVARLLRERGDGVRALVRDPSRAGALEALGCRLVPGDLSDESRLTAACAGADVVVHCAARCEVGVLPDGRAELVDTNVGGTERMLGAALSAGVRRAVHVSTVAVLGNTCGAVVDETHRRPDDVPVTSVYEQTSALAHRRAHEIGRRGLPLVSVLPGAVYGAGDPSPVGDLAVRLMAGRPPALAFPHLGITPVHRDDAADGVLRALDAGVAGQSYVLGGEPTTTLGLLTALAEASGRRPPTRTVPAVLLRALAPVGPLVGPALGLPANLRELVTSCDGVTFWARSAKAERELGWAARPLLDGMRELAGAHPLPA